MRQCACANLPTKILMEKKIENEKQAIAYLFGEMTGARRDEFEEKLFLDEDFSLFVDGVESDLIDDYIRGEMEAGEKLKFERAFLMTATGREKIQAARVLQARLFEEEKTPFAAEARVPFWQILADLFRAPNPALAGGLAAILLLLLGGIWFINRPATEVAIVENKNQPTVTPAQSFSPQNDASEENQSKTNESLEENKNAAEPNRNAPQNPQPNKPETAPAKPEAGEPDKKQKSPAAAPPQRVFAFSLLPPLRSGERPVLKIPAEARTVRLRLFDNFGEKYEKYAAELTGGDGNALWSWEIAAGKKRPRKSMTVSIPAAKLKADSYELVVRGVTADGRVEEISFYNFVIQKK